MPFGILMIEEGELSVILKVIAGTEAKEMLLRHRFYTHRNPLER